MEPQKVPLWKVTLTLGISWEKKGSFPERRVNQVRSVLSGGTRPQTPRVCPSLTYLTSSWFVTFHCFGDCFHIKDTTLLLCVPFTPHTLTMCGERWEWITHTQSHAEIGAYTAENTNHKKYRQQLKEVANPLCLLPFGPQFSRMELVWPLALVRVSSREFAILSILI